MTRAASKITVTLPTELVNAMEQWRQQSAESRSEFVQRAVEARLASNGSFTSASTTSNTTPRAVTWGELLDLLKELPRPDPDFLSDIEAIRNESRRMPLEDPWERSSTQTS